MIRHIYYLILSLIKDRFRKFVKKSISSLELKDGLSLIDVSAAGEIMPKWMRVESHLNYHGFEPDKSSREELLSKQNQCLSCQI